MRRSSGAPLRTNALTGLLPYQACSRSTVLHQHLPLSRRPRARHTIVPSRRTSYLHTYKCPAVLCGLPTVLQQEEKQLTEGDEDKMTLQGRSNDMTGLSSMAGTALDGRMTHHGAVHAEGRIEPEDGTLMCSYHGWRFQGDGACTKVPQALDAKANAAACSNSRSCAVSHPTQVPCPLQPTTHELGIARTSKEYGERGLHPSLH